MPGIAALLDAIADDGGRQDVAAISAAGQLGDFALKVPAGSDGFILVPYFEGEGTPNLNARPWLTEILGHLDAEKIHDSDE